jgi:hypothetical protein
MRLHQRDDEATSWFLASGERNLLLTLFSRPTEPRQRVQLSRTSEALEEQCQSDLAGELETHRAEVRSRLVMLLGVASPIQMTIQTPTGPRDDSGWILRLTPEDREFLLQALNELRLGAWEQLGRPDPPELPDNLAPTSPDILHWWNLEISSRFQGRLLSEEFPE